MKKAFWGDLRYFSNRRFGIKRTLSMRFISCHEIFCELGLSLGGHFFAVLTCSLCSLVRDTISTRIPAWPCNILYLFHIVFSAIVGFSHGVSIHCTRCWLTGSSCNSTLTCRYTFVIIFVLYRTAL